MANQNIEVANTTMVVAQSLSQQHTNVLIVIVILFHLTLDWFTTFTPEFRLPSLAMLP